MIKKTITYTDFNGLKKTEDFYFHLSKVELLDMHASTEGGLDRKIESIAKAENEIELYKLFKSIFVKAYGVKTLDGRFEKTEELTRHFEQTEAFDQLLMECVTDAEKAASFIESLIPSNMIDEVKNNQ